MKHIIAMNCRINQLTGEHQETIIRLVNDLASHRYEYQVHAMNRIEKIQKVNPYCDNIEGFEKLTMDLEDIEVMTYQCKQVDIGDKCVECLKSTAFGTGLFINRIPADNDEYIGWLCPECNWHECDRCDEKIYCDEDITAYDVFDENKNFSDGAYRVHYECLTEEEKKLLEENQ